MRDRVERLCAAATEATALRRDVLDALRRVVGFDAYAFVLTDPETEVGVQPLAELPVPSDIPKVIRAKYQSTVNRWTGLGPPATLTGPSPWRDLLSRYGVSDVLSACFRDQFGCWAFLDLWRRGGTFAAADVESVASISAPVTRALRRCQAATFGSAAPARRVDPVVLLLNAELHVVGQTAATAAYLRTLVPPPEGAAPIPASAYNVAAQLLANEAGVDRHPPMGRVHLADGVWLAVRAGRIDQDTIAVSIEQASPGERVGIFARAFGFTARETDLLERLAVGADTRELARTMHLSEHTVQDHLKSVFAKTSVRTRRALLARALGT
ncbi:helix-turn-helix transcriptional regulator [Labedaea rhizosphaerae]|uniref:helix-turn-helix transcriptional regulator n=1 Tax=Labedaea rhizosphaerae TaxID=598644 RepID=UPI001FB6D879|nr:helix-turn-helix transcriptional regulator [Labedaea rhizosphaerae]